MSVFRGLLMEVTVNEVKCLRCGYGWVPRKPDVRICPRCKSAWWDKIKIKDVKG